MTKMTTEQKCQAYGDSEIEHGDHPTICPECQDHIEGLIAEIDRFRAEISKNYDEIRSARYGCQHWEARWAEISKATGERP